jgi:hypothetical protein
MPSLSLYASFGEASSVCMMETVAMMLCTNVFSAMTD